MTTAVVREAWGAKRTNLKDETPKNVLEAEAVFR